MKSKVRKQVYELSAADFDRIPVWEFAMDEEGDEAQDEATVRPYELRGKLDPTDGMFVVRARFVLADGTLMSGYLTPPIQGDSSLGTLQPVVLTPQGQVMFWFGTIAPKPEILANSYARLGKSIPSQVFPLRFEADVPLLGGPIVGDIPGFLILEDFRAMRTRVAT